MGPIEYVYITIGIIFAFIGVVRGYQRELGNTIIFMYVIAALGFLDDQYLDKLFQQIGSSIFGVNEATLNQFLLLSYTLVFGIIVFWSYQGVTFDFGGKPVTGILGFLISLGVGLINGYLVAGTLWYYTDKFEYPFAIFQLPLSATAEALVNYLPQTIFGNPVFWALPATALMLIRIRK